MFKTHFIYRAFPMYNAVACIVQPDYIALWIQVYQHYICKANEYNKSSRVGRSPCSSQTPRVALSFYETVLD